MQCIGELFGAIYWGDVLFNDLGSCLVQCIGKLFGGMNRELFGAM